MNGIQYHILLLDINNYEEIRIGEWFLYRTYEEAELDCIIKLIEIVKVNTA